MRYSAYSRYSWGAHAIEAQLEFAIAWYSVRHVFARRNLPYQLLERIFAWNGSYLPVTHTYTKGKEQLEPRAKLSTDVLWGHFCREHGNKHSSGAHTKAGYDSACVETTNGARIDHLKNSTHEKHDGANNHGPPSAQARSDGPYHETPKKCTGL